MKKIALYSTFLILLSWPVYGTQIGLTDEQKESPTNAWGDAIDNTQLSIGFNKDENDIKTNQPIQLLVRIKNMSTNEDYSIFIQRPLIYTDGLLFNIKSPSGKDISPVFHRFFRATGAAVRIHPNQIDGFIFNLGDICKINEIGTYEVTAKIERWSQKEHKKYEVISNHLFISVTN